MTLLDRLRSLAARAKTILATRWTILVAALLAAVLCAPSLGAGLNTEDWVQRQLVQHGDYDIPWRVNLYGHQARRAVEEVEKDNFEYKVFGWFPWITQEHFDVSFWRPLASLTHHLDYRAWPSRTAIMHAQNLLWYALLAGLVVLLYRRLLAPGWLAGLAGLLYAVDDAHGHAVGWLANRNGIMAAAFGVAALWAHDRWRRSRWTPGALLTALCLLLGLLSAEFALCTAGYLAAHALVLDPARPRRRVLAAGVWVVPLAGWAATYRALGHESVGSGLYINPVSNPAAFLFELVERGLVLLLGQLGAPPSNLWVSIDRREQGYLVLFAALFVIVAAKLLWPLLKRDRIARFWALGMVLSLPPACATFPEDRLLFFAGLGAMPLVARYWQAVFGPERSLWPRRAPAVALGAFWILLHGAAAPALLPYRSLHMARYDAKIRRAGDALFALVSPEQGDSLVVVNGPDFYFLGMLPFTRVARGLPTVGRMIALAGTLDPIDLTRVDEHTIELTVPDGFLSRTFNRIYRGRSYPMRRSQRISLLGLEIEVTEVDQWGEPTRARFEFALDLDSPRLKWAVWKNGTFERWTPPAVGETVTVQGD